MMKNPHAVALGRLGGAKGGPARAKALSAKRRSAIAQGAALARARSMSAAERHDLARRAAAARWAGQLEITTALEAPRAVRQLFRNYDLGHLEWRRREHRYVIVREVLLRGDNRAVRWLRTMLSASKIRSLVRSFAGAGCDEAERRTLRSALRLTVHDIPVRTRAAYELEGST